MRFFLRLAYNGGSFHGWQRQPNARSVQQTLEESLSTMFQREIPITGAGRTDTGVHAREMYAHFDVEAMTIEKGRFLTSLNRLVGKEIAVYDLLEVNDDAHARFDALSRTYRYYITREKDPFLYGQSHYMAGELDVAAMNEAAEILKETSDFTSFAKLHTDNKTNICRVSEAFWTPDSRGMLVFTISADRFLRNMVRAVVGTLVMVGSGKMNLRRFCEVIDKKDRCEAGTSMPPQALFLEKITYPEHIFRQHH